MTDTTIDPPGAIPDDLAEAIADSTDEERRAIIHYARQLVHDHPSATEALDPREGEKILEIEDQGGYTSVLVERPDESGEARGPFAYRVQWEPGFGDAEGHFQWHYLGKAESDGGAE